ncbi:MAG: PDDEXK nuclease domain-containing protein [Ignavibacteriota bacterium]
MSLAETNIETKSFVKIVDLIKQSKQRAFAAVNVELINLYWNIGEYISNKTESDGWGKSTVEELSRFIQNEMIGARGFSTQNLWRMKQFFEIYSLFPNLSTLLRELTWSNNLHILTKTKTIEEKEFYLKLAVKEKYSARELERQIKTGVYERFLLSNKKLSTMLRELNGNSIDSKLSPLVTELEKPILQQINEVFRDKYVFEFLDLPENFSEKDLRKSLVKNLKEFIIELGKGFAFVGEEYRVQVSTKDFFVDLLFYHRGLQCLVAIDLKIDDFSPEYLGKMNFYLEALDKTQKLDHENPSVGLILCKTKDDEIVKYALNRSLSPTKIAEYETQLIDKNILKKKLHELGEYYLSAEKIKSAN